MILVELSERQFSLNGPLAYHTGHVVSRSTAESEARMADSETRKASDSETRDATGSKFLNRIVSESQYTRV